MNNTEICPTCGSSVPEDARLFVCPDCGTEGYDVCCFPVGAGTKCLNCETYEEDDE